MPWERAVICIPLAPVSCNIEETGVLSISQKGGAAEALEKTSNLIL